MTGIVWSVCTIQVLFYLPAVLVGLLLCGLFLLFLSLTVNSGLLGICYLLVSSDRFLKWDVDMSDNINKKHLCSFFFSPDVNFNYLGILLSW